MKKKVLLLYQKRNYELKTKGKNDLQPTSKEHVYRVGFYTIPLILVHIQSWHKANAKKVGAGTLPTPERIHIMY